MRGAEKPDIFRASIATAREGVIVMELESMPLRTSLAAGASIGTLSAVSLPNETFHRSDDTTDTRRRIGVVQILFLGLEIGSE